MTIPHVYLRTQYSPYVPNLQNALNAQEGSTIIQRLNPLNLLLSLLARTRLTQTRINLNGKYIPLTTISESKPRIGPFKNQGYYLLTHTKPKYIKKILSSVEQTWRELQELRRQPKTPEILERITEKIAQIHWLTVQAMPFNRGSAGITDLTTKTLFEYMGVQTSPWKKGLAPDLEAFVLPLDEYVKNYKNLFSNPLTFIGGGH